NCAALGTRLRQFSDILPSNDGRNRKYRGSVFQVEYEAAWQRRHTVMGEIVSNNSQTVQPLATRPPLWRRLIERRRNRRLSLHELREMRDAATRIPRRQLQIFVSLIDLQIERSANSAERGRLQQLRCHISTRMVVEKHISLGHLPGGVKLEVVLAEVCRGIADGYRNGGARPQLYWRLGSADIDRDRALSVALLLSEVLSECMNFTCNQPYERRIDVALNRLDHGEAELSIKDNCLEGAELAEQVLRANPLPQRFALRCGGTLRSNGAPHFSLQLSMPTLAQQPR
ncbi:MAG: hypothetical protein ABI439_10400, partial [Rhodospirillales bacterium]